METTRTGVVIKLLEKNSAKKELSLPKKIHWNITNGLNSGLTMFIVELSEKDIELETEVTSEDKENFFNLLENLKIRIAFYIKSKNHVISTDQEIKRKAKKEILKIGSFISEIDASKFDIPLICHIGGAKGNRKKSMSEFCKFFDGLSWKIQKQIAIINDEKPSLFSVKDLLSFTYIEKKIPIVFRTVSHRTNQGGLSYKESLFLAASTWAERANPILFYCPIKQEETVTVNDLNPYNLVIDVAFDNNLPDPQ
jgi:UV DNA damage repair endonuclease